jgi:hypothetical protein
MSKYIAVFAAFFGLITTPVLAFAAEQQQDASAQKPARLSDGELDKVVGGDPLLFVNVQAPIGVHIEPITVNVAIPVNVAAIVQANVLGNGSFDALAVGTQNNFNFASGIKPGG